MENLTDAELLDELIAAGLPNTTFTRAEAKNDFIGVVARAFNTSRSTVIRWKTNNSIKRVGKYDSYIIIAVGKERAVAILVKDDE